MIMCTFTCVSSGTYCQTSRAPFPAKERYAAQVGLDYNYCCRSYTHSHTHTHTDTHTCFADDIDGLAGEKEELAKLVKRLDKASMAWRSVPRRPS